MDFSYLSTIIGHLKPILTLMLPVIGTSLLLTFFYKIIKR